MPEDEYDETGDQEQHPAERRIENRAGQQAIRELAVVDAGLGDLSKEQRVAVLAVAGSDLSPENLKAAHQTLWKKDAVEETPAETGPTAEELASDGAALARMGQTSAMTPGQVPAPDGLGSLVSRMATLPPAAFSPGGPLYQEVMRAIPEAGLEFGLIEHGGGFSPL